MNNFLNQIPVPYRFAYFLIALVLCSSPIHAQKNQKILIENVRIFDGSSEELSTPANVLIDENTIKTISESPIKVKEKVEKIPGNGYTLMPGLIDAHEHLFQEAYSSKVKGIFDSKDEMNLVDSLGEIAKRISW